MKKLWIFDILGKLVVIALFAMALALSYTPTVSANDGDDDELHQDEDDGGGRVEVFEIKTSSKKKFVIDETGNEILEEEYAFVKVEEPEDLEKQSHWECKGEVRDPDVKGAMKKVDMGRTPVDDMDSKQNKDCDDVLGTALDHCDEIDAAAFGRLKGGEDEGDQKCEVKTYSFIPNSDETKAGRYADENSVSERKVDKKAGKESLKMAAQIVDRNDPNLPKKLIVVDEPDVKSTGMSVGHQESFKKNSAYRKATLGGGDPVPVPPGGGGCGGKTCKERKRMISGSSTGSGGEPDPFRKTTSSK